MAQTKKFHWFKWREGNTSSQRFTPNKHQTISHLELKLLKLKQTEKWRKRKKKEMRQTQKVCELHYLTNVKIHGALKSRKLKKESFNKIRIERMETKKQELQWTIKNLLLLKLVVSKNDQSLLSSLSCETCFGAS